MRGALGAQERRVHLFRMKTAMAVFSDLAGLRRTGYTDNAGAEAGNGESSREHPEERLRLAWFSR